MPAAASIKRIIKRNAATAWLVAALTAGLAVVGPSLAQQVSASTPEAGAATVAASAHPRGALYRVQDGPHTLYLLGTIHVGNADFYPLEPRILAALQKATTLALELDPQNAGALQESLQRHGMYPEGQTFAGDIDGGTRRLLQAQLQRYGIPTAKVARMKPWLLATLLTLGEAAQQGYTSDFAVDTYLATWVRQRGKNVIELENAEAQLALFGKLDSAQQLRFLQDTLRDLNDPVARRQIVDLAQAWDHADTPALERYLAELQQDPGFASRFTRDVLLAQRNPGLADGIAALLHKESDSVAAIGVLHLIGAGSVVQRLRDKGLKVEQLY